MNYAVIMAGGSGTRFWPLSRRKFPKQCLPMYTDKALIADTAIRISPLFPQKNIFVITGAEHAGAVKNACRGAVPGKNIIAEPCGRNTAPCLGLASVYLQKNAGNDDALLVALPADHVVTKPAAFRATLKRALRVARTGDGIVTFGIAPSYPETGYGYIEVSKKMNGNSVCRVRRFVEKPDQRTAQRYCRSGRFFWNSGIFVFKASVMLAAIEAHMPGLYRELCRFAPAIGTKREQQALRRLYRTISSQSIDYGVMEHYHSVQLVPADIGWNDVGSWRALHDLLKDKKQTTVVKGNARCIRVKNSFVYNTDRRFIGLVGVEDLIVVAAGDAILVVHRDQAQAVKTLVDMLGKTAAGKKLL